MILLLDDAGETVSRHRTIGRANRALARAIRTATETGTGQEFALVIEDVDGSRAPADGHRDGQRRARPAENRTVRVNVPVTVDERQVWTSAAVHAGVDVAEYVRGAVEDRIAVDRRREKLGLRNPKTHGATS